MHSTEFQKITYLDLKSIEGRNIPLLPYWDGKTWYCWAPNSEQTKIISLEVGSPITGDYVAKTQENGSDLFIPFVNTVWQKATWIETYKIIETICDDFHCLAASVAKIKHIHKSRKDLNDVTCSLFVATELQYICIVARGIFDLLQEFISIVWNQKIFLLDQEMNKRKKGRKLPSTFSKIVLKEKLHPKTVQEISEEYFFPLDIASEYEKATMFFGFLRQYRDKVVHGYNSTPLIYTTDRGFCFNVKDKPFDQIATWNEKYKYNENLVSVLPWINQIINQTIYFSNSIVSAFERHNAFLPDIAPGYKIFVRGVCNKELVEMQNDVCWWD